MKRDQPTLVTWPTFPLEAQQRLSRIWNNHWDAKRVFYIKGWISGPVAVQSNKWQRMDLVWYLPGLFFQNSHTCSCSQKRSSAIATSTNEALKCLSNGLRSPLTPQHSLEGTSGKNLPQLLLTCYFSMTLSHDQATCKRFSHLSLLSRGPLDHKTAVLTSGVNPSNVGGGQCLRPMGHAPKQNLSQLLEVLQSLLLIISVPTTKLYIF